MGSDYIKLQLVGYYQILGKSTFYVNYTKHNGSCCQIQAKARSEGSGMTIRRRPSK